MWKLAGKKVTQVGGTFISDGCFKIKEDGKEWMWAGWMMDGFKEPEVLKLKESISGRHEATFGSNGDLTIGCTTVKFETVKQIYDAAVKAQKGKKK